MKPRILVALTIVLSLLLIVASVSAQGPIGSEQPGRNREKDVSDAAGDVSPLSTWGETVAGSWGSWGTRWVHTNTSTTHYTGRFESYSTRGIGVLGYALASSGSPLGIYGWTQAASGRGVYGYNHGASSPGIGVMGQSNATSGGRGVFGYSALPTGYNYGVFGESASTTGRGVIGFSTATTGSGIGVWGYSNAPTGTGVYGYVRPGTGSGVGIVSQSYASTGTGVYSWGARYGTRTYSSHTYGDALYARATSTSGPAWAVNAHTASPSGWSGVFLSEGNGVYIGTPSGKAGLIVAGGTKSATVQAAGQDRLVYSEEATEVWFADYGFGKLENGTAVVQIDPLFADTVNLDAGYHVFVQAYGDAEISVSERTANQFVVKLRDGAPDVEFSYRLVAKRLGYESARMNLAPWASTGDSIYAAKGSDRSEDAAIEAGALEALEEIVPMDENALDALGELEVPAVP
jgi:hypothetical protein